MERKKEKRIESEYVLTITYKQDLVSTFNCLVYILTNFRVLRAPKSWSKYFFSRFQPFFFFQNIFQLISVWNQKNTFENKQNITVFFGPL